jgi:hypothetical protein
MQKTVLSIYCDDTNPYNAPPEAFKTFLDFVSAESIAGESSVILGYGCAEHGLLSCPTTDLQRAYILQLQRAYACGVDSHFELMTHAGLYDFEANRLPAEAIHEGLWLYEPAISVDEYEAYFQHILDEGEKIGVRFTGLTWPGCGCTACNKRYRQLWSESFKRNLSEIKSDSLNMHRLKSTLQGFRTGPEPNPNVWKALLNLAKCGKFREHTIPCFFGNERKQCAARLMASEGNFGVYDLPPVAADRLGLWLNDPHQVNADYYITKDGRSGRIVDLVRAEAPYCLLYAHWQGLNPSNGVGWDAFTRVISRVQRSLGDQIIWMRPSQFTNQMLHSSGKTKQK